MRGAKLFLAAVLILLFFISAITIFLPSKITVSKSVIINAEKSVIAEEITNFNNWKNWYPAFQNKNVSIQIFKRNNTSFVNLTNENNQKLRLVVLKSGAEDIEISVNDNKNNSKIYQFLLISNGNGETQIIWNANIFLGWYPWKKIGGIFLDKLTGPGYEVTLQHLKAAAENAAH